MHMMEMAKYAMRVPFSVLMATSKVSPSVLVMVPLYTLPKAPVMDGITCIYYMHVYMCIGSACTGAIYLYIFRWRLGMYMLLMHTQRLESQSV